jgi:class 3 adenylate cyclase
MKTFHFKHAASAPTNGLALIYDLEGFSRFFNQPDVQHYVPKFLNHVSTAIQTCLYGGLAYWSPNARELGPLRSVPIHEKFMGDGALYVWVDRMDDPIRDSTVRALCNRLWNLKTDFDKVARKAFDEIPVANVPSKIRFGLARGTIFELATSSGGDKEYIGYCINLASRLQKYCPDLGFIASARLNLTQGVLTEHGYTRVMATSIKGFPDGEVVIVDKEEYDALGSRLKKRLFADL